MAIQYPVDPASRWAVLQISTGQIIARNRPWPVADGGPIEGLDPDFVYLLQLQNAEPDYDSRLYSLVADEVVDIQANEIRRTWLAEPLPTPERIVAAENEEAHQFSRHVQLHRILIDHALLLGYLASKLFDNQDVPQRASVVAQRVKNNAVKLQQNRDRHEANVARIAAGEDPDLDVGWATPDA